MLPPIFATFVLYWRHRVRHSNNYGDISWWDMLLYRDVHAKPTTKRSASSPRTATTDLPTFSDAPNHRCPQAFAIWTVVLSALWLIAVFAGPALLAATGLQLDPHGHARAHAHGHPFVDARVLWGIPNAMDVLSNAPISLAGVFGLLALRGRALPGATQSALRIFFVGLLITGVSSAQYHWAPDAEGLVWDRLGMAITFAGALALTVAERVGQAPAQRTLVVALAAAMLSAALPFTHSNVLPWAVVQFGGVAFVASAAMLRPAANAIGIRLGVLMAWYVLAKALESGDETVFHVTGEVVSGHSLKHLAAAFATWPVLIRLMPRRARQNAADSGAVRA